MSTTFSVYVAGILAAAALTPASPRPLDGRLGWFPVSLAALPAATSTARTAMRSCNEYERRAPGRIAVQGDRGRGAAFHEIEPNCPAPPPGTSRFDIPFVIDHSPNPVAPSEPAFPRDFCPSGSVLYGTADAKGMAPLLGRFTMRDRYCIRPPEVIGVATFTTETGDTLGIEYVAIPTVVPPPFPNVEFSGSGTIKGGTGAFAGAVGTFGLAGKQLGVLIPTTNIAVQSAFIFCGYINGR